MARRSSESIGIRNCSFAFQCSQQWENLSPTDKPNIRHCATCDTNVHLCVTKNELVDSIKANRCVAVDVLSREKAKPRTVRMMGAPRSPD